MESAEKSQELEYLRGEINQLCNYWTEHNGKTINAVLLIWGGSLAVFAHTKPPCIDPSNIPVYLVLATIFFISNLVLFLTAHYFNDVIDDLTNQAMFLAVFYENRPRKPDKDRTDGTYKNYCWELATYEMATVKKKKTKRSRKNSVYVILAFFSTIVLLVLCLLTIGIHMFARSDAWQCCMWQCAISIFLFTVYFFYIGTSIYWIKCMYGYAPSISDYRMKRKHLKAFIEYSLKTEHYSKKDIEDRFGKVILDSLDLSWRQKTEPT